MSKSVPTMRICQKRKEIILNRPTISLLGNTPCLDLRYDTPNKRLIVLPSFTETLDVYTIPDYYWNDKRQPCRIQRLAFFLDLKSKLNWEIGKSYVVYGIFQVLDGQRLVVFNFDDMVENPSS